MNRAELHQNGKQAQEIKFHLITPLKECSSHSPERLTAEGMPLSGDLRHREYNTTSTAGSQTKLRRRGTAADAMHCTKPNAAGKLRRVTVSTTGAKRRRQTSRLKNVVNVLSRQARLKIEVNASRRGSFENFPFNSFLRRSRAPRSDTKSAPLETKNFSALHPRGRLPHRFRIIHAA